MRSKKERKGRRIERSMKRHRRKKIREQMK
jgi:hypothetical protein